MVRAVKVSHLTEEETDEHHSLAGQRWDLKNIRHPHQLVWFSMQLWDKAEPSRFSSLKSFQEKIGILIFLEHTKANTTSSTLNRDIDIDSAHMTGR